MNKLLCMTVFTRVVESCSVSAAAEQLGLSASAVTKCLARLEKDLSVQLITRTTRAIRLTELGETYYRQCMLVLGQIQDGEALLKQQNVQVSGNLRIRVPVDFGLRRLLPELGRFYESYPGIQLSVRLGDKPVDLMGEDLDMAVVRGPLPSSTYIVRSLVKGHAVTAASPDYLLGRGVPVWPAELANHPCIALDGQPWSFLVNGQLTSVAVPARLVVDTESALREAALAGLGLVQASSWVLEEDIRLGRLRPVLVDYRAPVDELVAVCTPQRHLPNKMRAMMEFLREVAQQGTGPEEPLGDHAMDMATAVVARAIAPTLATPRAQAGAKPVSPSNMEKVK